MENLYRICSTIHQYENIPVKLSLPLALVAIVSDGDEELGFTLFL